MKDMQHARRIISIDDFREGAKRPCLSISGQTQAELAFDLEEKLQAAAEANDRLRAFESTCPLDGPAVSFEPLNSDQVKRWRVHVLEVLRGERSHGMF